MNKRIIAILLCCIFCLTALFSGCGEVAQNDDVKGDGLIVGDGDMENLTTEKEENKTTSKFSKELRDAVSAEVLALAEKGELMSNKVTNYAAYKLFLLQGNKDIDKLRTVASPGRTADIPFEKIFNTDIMSLYSVNYYISEESRNNVDNAVYFREAFGTVEKGDYFNVKAFYLVPGEVDTIEDAIDKVVFSNSIVVGLERQGYTISYIDFNESMYVNGDTTQLKSTFVSTQKVEKVVFYNDSLCLGYTSTGLLRNIWFFGNGVLLNVSIGDGIENFKEATNHLSTAVTDCFSVDTISKVTAQFNEITNVGKIPDVPTTNTNDGKITNS